MDLKVEYAFYLIQTQFRVLANDSRAECNRLRKLAGSDRPDNALKENYLTFARGEVLYSLDCPRRTVYLATDWDRKRCYKDLPVKLSDKPDGEVRFLTPRGRLLINVLQPENCSDAYKLP